MSSVKYQVSRLNALDRRILNRLQEDIPFCPKPWDKFAQELGIDSAVLLNRIDFLKKKGIIRRIAATFNPQKIGSVSTLVAVKAFSLKTNAVAKRISVFSEVTHNYKRDAEYDIWFTLVAPNRKRIAQIIKKLRQDRDIERIVELPAKRLFKISVSFKV